MVAKSSLKVVVVDAASPRPPGEKLRVYTVALELAGVKTVQTLGIADSPGFAEAEFPIEAAAKGRLTVEKPSLLDLDHLSGSVRTDILLEDTYEYNLEVVGTAPAFQVVPVGFSTAANHLIDELTLTFEPADKGGVRSVLRLLVAPVPEFAAPARAQQAPKGKPPAQARTPSELAGGERFRPIAHYFPGTDFNQRALVLAGVHGSEPEGVRTVALVLDALRAGRRPKFTTVVVTAIIPRTQPPGEPQEGNDRDRKINGLDPNRNFPLPGTSYASARELGRTRTDKAECIYIGQDPKTKQGGLFASEAARLFPETRLLLTLLERFKPHRLASVHSHRPTQARGDSSGIFVDPRGGVSEPDEKGKRAKTRQPGEVVVDPADHRVLLNPSVGSPDIELTKQMICDFESRVLDQRLNTAFDPLMGNKVGKDGKTLSQSIDGITTIYKAGHPPGNSLGMWAPEAVFETWPGVSAPRGNRPAILTVTVELPRKQGQTAIVALERIHADVLLAVFLGVPPAPAPAPKATPKAEAKKKADAKKKAEAKLPKVIDDCPKV